MEVLVLVLTTKSYLHHGIETRDYAIILKKPAVSILPGLASIPGRITDRRTNRITIAVTKV